MLEIQSVNKNSSNADKNMSSLQPINEMTAAPPAEMFAPMSPSFTIPPAQKTESVIERQPRSHVVQIQPAEVMYKEAAPIIRNPLKPPGPCHKIPPGIKHCPMINITKRIAIKPGPDRYGVAVEKYHLHRYINNHPRGLGPKVNEAAITPLTARPYRGVRAKTKRPYSEAYTGEELDEWAKAEEQLINYRDHIIAQEIGYETLVGNLLHIDIPGGKDINRSWENFLSVDEMEWGFPYYKGSKERPRLKQMEPYLAHQIKEGTWKYPKSRIFNSPTDD